MPDPTINIRQRMRSHNGLLRPHSGNPRAAGLKHTSPSSLGRKVFKWLAILVGAFIALIAALGFIAESIATPEDKARWAQETAAREKQRSEAALKAEAAEYGIRYESDWGNGFKVSAEEMGDDWPFIHDSAIIFCKMTDYGRPMVTVSFDGALLFGLNGVALGKEKMMDVDVALRRHPEYGTFTGDVSSLIRRAIENCA